MNDICTDILELWGYITYAWELVIFLIALIIVIIYLIKFRKNINSDSIRGINKLVENGKYIQLLYTELNEINEELRYFLFQKKWKKRVVNQYNILFNSSLGRLLRKSLNKDFYISPSLSYSELIEKFNQSREFFKHAGRLSVPKEKGDLNYKVMLDGIALNWTIEQLIAYCTMASSRSTMIVGPAGNGKTNLLCNFVELASKSRNPCVFIEAKQIRGNCIEFFKERIKLPCFINFSVFLYIINFSLFIFRKNLYIIIDAVNENDDPSFIETLDSFSKISNKFGRIRSVYSCRSEFFEERFSKLFYVDPESIYIRNIPHVRFEYRAYEHLFRRYREYFNFKGTVSHNVKRQLYYSLILLRIFFEINKDTSSSVIELHSSLLFNEYIKKISRDQYKDFENILKKIVNVMVEQYSFNEIALEHIDMTEDEYDILKNIIDNNLILSRKISKNQKLLTEQNQDFLYFPFDELRDYCITRYVLLKCEESITNYDYFFELTREIVKKHLSPAEGLLKFGYFYFRSAEKFDACITILKEFEVPIQRNYYQRDRSTSFNCLGLSILFNCLSNLHLFEEKYLYMITKRYKADFWLLIERLLYNDLEGISPGVDVLFKIFPNNTLHELKLRLPNFNQNIQKTIHVIMTGLQTRKLSSTQVLPVHSIISFLNKVYAISIYEHITNQPSDKL
ncbi:MAG: hypothetical protein LBJ14_07710 [Desulfarculales bacterium]|jgi:hypothetical protein|nr:hypothetical protein [Desulfarculales bacterium]